MSAGTVPADDPRRHVRVRLRAAQWLVWALQGGGPGAQMAWDAAVDEFGSEAEIGEAVRQLQGETTSDSVEDLQAEIAYLTLCLENVRVSPPEPPTGDSA
ncbi:hypothetical protein MSIMFI_03795 [Mycobacterium simulans]|uniref:hypothetical protein n=1 Tax=Mycobacterium simulans TaxID=627089 RepID=UPI0017483424|nr:hypothetical protein [Mycobacterium simulans]SON62270.1 hypothetical protein MSIMFI_03795 [Mycobacterium simulans]